jgi:hypothetical protein
MAKCDQQWKTIDDLLCCEDRRTIGEQPATAFHPRFIVTPKAPPESTVQPQIESKPTKANAALRPQVAPANAFRKAALKKAAFYADDNVLIFNMDVREAMAHLAKARSDLSIAWSLLRRSTVSETTEWMDRSA